MLIVTSSLLGLGSMLLVLVNPDSWRLCSWACIVALVLILIDTAIDMVDARLTLRQAEQIAEEDQVRT